MNMVCLDLEGVLVPEIWIAFSEESGIPEREEPRVMSRIMISSCAGGSVFSKSTG